MYFGDYLVEKKILNHDQLLTALCFQMESMPSMIRIVSEQKIVNANDLLEMLKSQVKDELDILTILKKQKKIDDKKCSELELLQISSRIPLGEAIVKLNIVESDKINSALIEFYENKFNNLEENTKKPESHIEVNEAALESLRELGIQIDAPAKISLKTVESEKPFIDQYLDLFSEKYKNKIIKLVTIITNEIEGTSDISNYYNSLYRDLHLLKGAITLSELQTQDELITNWENQIEVLLRKNNDEIRGWSKNYLPILLKSIDLLWYARGVIAVNKSDLALAEDGEFLSESALILDKISIK
jgi:hypothetical protein